MITPSYIGFASVDDIILDRDKIGQIPYNEIKMLFFKNCRRIFNSLDFNEELTNLLKKDKISYEQDQYGNYGRPDGTHIFKSQYYDLYFKIKTVSSV